MRPRAPPKRKNEGLEDIVDSAKWLVLPVVLAISLSGVVLDIVAACAQEALPQQPVVEGTQLPREGMQLPASKDGKQATEAPSGPQSDPVPEQTIVGPTDNAKSAQDVSAQQRQPGAKSLPRDLSPWGMYQAADVVVKAMMIGLAIASFVTWTVWLAKAIELWGAKRRLKYAIRQIATAQNLDEAVDILAPTRGTGAALVHTAAEEMVRSAPALAHMADEGAVGGVKERVTSRLSRVEAAAGRRMTLGTGVLATIGATAPFVGLFGTVWGIMNSFIGISQSQTTNLAVVAPGIAEALLATALGLVAAIPAVIIYNVFARSIAGYRLLLADASASVERLVSWELDLRRIPRGTDVTVLVRAAE